MEQRYWYQKQLRILQTVLREPDLEDYSAKDVVAYMKAVHANCIVVNAGGIIDFFPIERELGRKNRFMGEQDMLVDLTRECHENGIHVMVRIDFRGVEKERYEERPDWFAKDAEQNPVVGWKFIHKPCYNNRYANEHAQDFIRKLMSKYPIDGVWENSVGFGSGPCYCRRCQEQYRKDTGKEIPTGEDYRAENFSEYRRWKARCADRHLAKMRQTVKEFGEDKAYCAEIFGMFHASNAWMTGIDLYNAKDHFDFLVSPAFLDGAASERTKWDDLTYAADSIRFLKSISPEKEAVLLCGNNGTKWRYIKAPETETRIWMWEAASAGGDFWNCMFNGQCPSRTIDQRNAYIEREVYSYLEAHQKEMEKMVPLAEVGIFYSKPSRDLFGNDEEEKDGYGVFLKGAQRVLTECHIAWQFVPELTFELEKIRHLKTLLLPNAACLSEKQMDVIREYVKEGGGIVAGFKTSLYDENGKKRQDFGLRDLFGCSFTGIEEDTSFDCYQKIRKAHKVLDGMGADRTGMLMNEGNTLLCTMENTESGCGGKAEMICSYVPRIENQPPEFAWRERTDTAYPTVVVNTFGKGRVVYFANQTEKLCRTNGHEDFLDLYRNAIEWAAAEPFQMTVKAPGSVHTTWLCRPDQPGKILLSFVNTTAGGQRPVREVVPVGEIMAVLRGKLKRFEIWKGEDGITADQEEEKVVIRMEKLREFAAVLIEVE